MYIYIFFQEFLKNLKFLKFSETENGLTTDIFVVKYTGRGLVVKQPGVLSKVQMLNLVLGVGVFSLLATFVRGSPSQGFLSISKISILQPAPP